MNKLSRYFFVFFSVLTLTVFAETRNIVPRGPSEGSIGTSAKPWGDGWFDDLHVGGNSIFSNLEGTNGVAITPTETGAAVGLDTNALTSLPKFLKWNGTNIVWDDKFDIPEGMDVPAYLASLNVPNFMQQESVEVPGVVASIYENNPGEELVSEIDFGTRELGRFDLEEITGPSQFIVTETNGYYGKFNSSVEYTKVRPGVCIVINGQYYPIADITDGDGWGQGNGSVKLSLPLVPGETYDVERYSGISSGEGYSRLSYAFDPDGAAEQFRAEPSTFYVMGWCCTPDFRIQYLVSWHYFYKSEDYGKTWRPICRVPTWWYTSHQHFFANMACSPNGSNVVTSIGFHNAGIYLHSGENYNSYIVVTTNGFDSIFRANEFGTFTAKDMYCAGSNKWGSTTFIAGTIGASPFVSTNGGISWFHPAWITRTDIKSMACDPDLTTVAFVYGNNDRNNIHVAEIEDPIESTSLINETVYGLNPSADLQPFRLRFARSGEFGETIDTNKLYILDGNWNNIRMDDCWWIQTIDRKSGNNFRVLSPFNSRIVQLQPLADGSLAIMCIPDTSYIAKFNINENAEIVENAKKTFVSAPAGNGFWRTDSQSINNNNVYNSLKINQTRPNVWYTMCQPYYPRARVSQDYGTTWKTIPGIDGGTWNNDYTYTFPIAGLGDEFIFAWPTPNNNRMKYENNRYKSLYLSNNDMTKMYTIDGTPFKFYELSWPATNRLYALVECGYVVLDNYQNVRLAVSEDKGKTWYFPGGPNHAYAHHIYAQSYTDNEGDIVTNVMVAQATYNYLKRPWLWNSKTDKWTSVEPWYYSNYNWSYHLRPEPARIYDGGNGWAGVLGDASRYYGIFWRVTNALSASARNQKSWTTRITSANDYSHYCNVEILDDPETGEEIWYYGQPEYTERNSELYSYLMKCKPDTSTQWELITTSPRGRYWTINIPSINVMWACVSTNGDNHYNVYKSSDGGETWENTTSMKPGLPINSATGSAYFSDAFGIWAVDKDLCWISYNDKFYETSDGGETWTYKGQAPHAANCYRIAGDNANRANTNMIWYTCVSDSDTAVPRIFYTTNQFETSEPFAWIEKKSHPNGIDYRYNQFTGLYSPTWNPDIVYSGIYNDWPIISRDGGKTWDYIGNNDLPADDPARENQFTTLTTAGNNYGWQITGWGDVVIYTKVYQPFIGSGWTVETIQSEVFISYEGELAGKPRIFQKLDLPDKYTTGNCPIARNGCVYAGNEIILNQGESFCYYNAGPDAQKLVGNNQTMITKTNGIDSSRWGQLEEVAVDSLYSKSTKSAVSVLFSFDGGSSYKKYDKLAQAWETVAYKNGNTWYYRTERNPGGEDRYSTLQANTPQAALSKAADYSFNRFSDEEISQVTDLEWNYDGAFDSETTSNMMFSVTFIPAEEYNGKAEVPAIYDVSFKTVMKSDLYTKKDQNYLVTQQEGETTSTVTKTNSAVANSVIYYLRNIP